MPFYEIDIDKEIKKRCDVDPDFKELWDNSRMEYGLLGDLIKLRKEKGISQAELAEKVNSNQRVVSRIEKHEQSPTLKTLCSWANALGAEIKLIRHS